MNKKTATALSRIILTSFVMLLNIAAISSAVTITWSNGAIPADANWNNTANWTGGVIPDAIDDYAKILMAAGPTLSTGQTAAAYRVYLEGTNGSMTMDGGTLNLNGSWLGIGYTAANSGTLTVNSGTINTTGALGNLYCGTAGTATLNMSGGAINVSGTFYVARDSGSNANVNLSGGTITCNALNMRGNAQPPLIAVGTINITGTGTLIFTSSALPVTTYISNGWIKAYNGAGIVIVDTTTTPGKTIVTGLISYKALIPNPTSGTNNVAVNGTNLTWRPGFGAASHDVYLGTSLSDVTSSNILLGDLNEDDTVDLNDMALLVEYWLQDPVGSEPYAGVNDDNIVDFFDYALLAQDWKNTTTFKGNQDANSFSPGTLAFGTNYYWRIDEVNGPNTVKGDIWNFTTQTGKASYVTPANNEPNVLSRAVLAWTAGVGATSHDVYLGTTNPPATLVSDNQTGTMYNPGGTLENSATYYWRIDENYGATTIQGDVWNFTTIDEANEPDLVFVHATDPQMGWSNCGGTTDYLWGTTVGKINNLNPDFMIVTGDLVDSSTSVPQVALYKSYRAALNPTIECYEVPGNHDLGEPPNQSKYDAWHNNYGYGTTAPYVPWYTFEYGNNLFIGLDTVVLVTDFNYPADHSKAAEELNWLSATLADANTHGYDHIFVFQHYGYTADKWVGGSPNKTTLYNLLNQYHVTALFAGHTHYDAYSNVNGMDDITERSCTCNLGGGPPPPGIGIIKVYPDRIERESRTLDSLP